MTFGVPLRSARQHGCIRHSRWDFRGSGALHYRERMSTQADATEARSKQLKAVAVIVLVVAVLLAGAWIGLSGSLSLSGWLAVLPGLLLIGGGLLWSRSSTLGARAVQLREFEEYPLDPYDIPDWPDPLGEDAEPSDR